jgi:S-DNA-T family DNA segregation ATPase FtsK/SpoIIIE
MIIKKMYPDYHNLANIFIPVEDVGTCFTKVLDQINDSVCGVECHLTGEGGNTYVIAPAFIDTTQNHVLRVRERPTEEFSFFEGYLSEAFFLPLKQGKNGLFIKELQELDLQEGEEVFVQWLVRRKYGWRDRAVDMYDSYLQGNEKPAWSSIGRKLQDKAVRVLGKAFPEPLKPYIDEAEDKIKGEGFQFQCRVAIKSERVEDIIHYIQYALEEYTAFNTLKLGRSVDKKVVSVFNECVLAAYTKDQILSLDEIFSLLGDAVEEAKQPLTETKQVAYSKAIELLPVYPREEIKPDETWFKRIAGAMKRVGLLDTARLNDEKITAGVRLTVVQAKIPTKKNLTHITNKTKDIQAALGLSSVSIGQGNEPDTVQFIIPNDKPTVISLRELLETEEFKEFAASNDLAFAVGVDEINQPLFLSLTKLVHLLVAGIPGSGKSVFLNALIISLLVNYTPDQLTFLMIDPKSVELQQYVGFPHVREVITDMSEAELALKRLVSDMDARYKLFAEAGVRDIKVYNKKASTPLPYMVCVIDEYADLKDTNPEVEDHVARLGQKARAAGIHLVIATQRPSTDIISGRVKAVIPNAISFNLNTSTNYRTVFAKTIPYNLLGKGDGVMRIEGASKEFQRFQSPMVSPDEVKEAEVYQNLIDFYGGSKTVLEASNEEEVVPVIEEVIEEVVEEEETVIDQLKRIIATTGETKTSKLREELGIKQNAMPDLMNQLVEEGWLKKHKSRAKGYELIADEEMKSEYLDE